MTLSTLLIRWPSVSRTFSCCGSKALYPWNSNFGQQAHARHSASLTLGEMPIKTTVRDHLTPPRMATIKNTESDSWWGCGETEASCTVGGNGKRCRHYGKQYGGSLKKTKNRTIIWSGNPIPGCLANRVESRTSNRWLYTHVHCSILHKNQKVEATQVSTDGWVATQTVVHPYSGMSFSLKKEGNPDTCSNVDKPWGHYAQWNKPVTKSQILYDST